MNTFNFVISILLTNTQALNLPIVGDLLENIGGNGSSQAEYAGSNVQSDSTLVSSSENKPKATQSPIKLAANLSDKNKVQPISQSSENRKIRGDQRGYDNDSRSKESEYNYDDDIRGADEYNQKGYGSYRNKGYRNLESRSTKKPYPRNYDTESFSKGSRNGYPRSTKSDIKDYNGYETNDHSRNIKDFKARSSNYHEDQYKNLSMDYSKFNGVTYDKYDNNNYAKGAVSGYKTNYGRSDEKNFEDDSCDDESDVKDVDNKKNGYKYAEF